MPTRQATVGEVEDLLRYPGQMVCVFYVDDDVWHERILLWKVRQRLWYILTPDGDVYQESFELDPQEGPSKYSIQGVHFRVRSDLRKPVYRIRQPLTREELRDRIEEAIKDCWGLEARLCDPPKWRSYQPFKLLGQSLSLSWDECGCL